MAKVGNETRLTTKQLAIDLVKSRNCDYSVTRANYPLHGQEIEVIPPDGFLFDGELTSLVCHSWKDILDRLPNYELLPDQYEWEN